LVRELTVANMVFYELGFRGYKMFYVDNRKNDETDRRTPLLNFPLRRHENFIGILIHTCLSGQFSWVQQFKTYTKGKGKFKTQF